MTNDLDVCYARDRKNLEALSAALIELGAKLRGAPEALPFRPDAGTLAAGDHFRFATKAGNLDCIGTPAGSRGYADLVAGATALSIGKMTVPIAAIEDLIRMKEVAGRPKDRAEIEILAAVREERKKRGES